MFAGSSTGITSCQRQIERERPAPFALSIAGGWYRAKRGPPHFSQRFNLRSRSNRLPHFVQTRCAKVEYMGEGYRGGVGLCEHAAAAVGCGTEWQPPLAKSARG
jgi:hypothetical protein